MSRNVRQLRLDVMEAARATGEPLETVRVALFSNTVEITEDTVLADLDVITIAGLAAQTGIAPAAPFDPGDGLPVCDVPTAPFAATTAVGLPVDVAGWAVLNTAGTALLAAELLDEPVPINAVADGVDVNAHIKYGR